MSALSLANSWPLAAGEGHTFVVVRGSIRSIQLVERSPLRSLLVDGLLAASVSMSNS